MICSSLLQIVWPFLAFQKIPRFYRKHSTFLQETFQSANTKLFFFLLLFLQNLFRLSPLYKRKHGYFHYQPKQSRDSVHVKVFFPLNDAKWPFFLCLVMEQRSSMGRFWFFVFNRHVMPLLSLSRCLLLPNRRKKNIPYSSWSFHQARPGLFLILNR